MVSRIARSTALTLATAVALGPAVAGAAESTRLVKARVTVAGDVRWFLHEVEVANKGDARRVSTVVLWQTEWLPAEPKGVEPPDGWSVRMLRREGPGGRGWSVQFECVPPKSAAGDEPAEGRDIACGIAAGESLKFRVVLPYRADYILGQPVLVGFSDGRLALAT